VPLRSTSQGRAHRRSARQIGRWSLRYRPIALFDQSPSRSQKGPFFEVRAVTGSIKRPTTISSSGQWTRLGCVWGGGEQSDKPVRINWSSRQIGSSESHNRGLGCRCDRRSRCSQWPQDQQSPRVFSRPPGSGRARPVQRAVAKHGARPIDGSIKAEPAAALRAVGSTLPKVAQSLPRW